MDFVGFFIEDCVQQMFFRGQFGFVFWSDFVNQDVVSVDFCIDMYDVVFVKVGQYIFGNVWNILSNFFSIQFGIMSVDFVFFDVD